MTTLAFPYRFDSRGRTAEVDSYHRHVANLVEQTLLTAPGERVNRPDFGAGLNDLVFEPGSEALTGAMDAMVRAAMQRWLAEVARVIDLAVTYDEGFLVVALEYEVLATGQRLRQDVRRPS
ncbi:GPW/gp25 family protein [Pacificoceanicola onchidii]|uniref:GPW/gp25 family protein n=1 Tax=Pacificoceanicola onchidii TaxID=2562685 RepID=UPI0010A31A68|nr:GPW/gp25 family protein [Pacificoceanicola onchidii]